jgi:hypothetical protein
LPVPEPKLRRPLSLKELTVALPFPFLSIAGGGVLSWEKVEAVRLLWPALVTAASLSSEQQLVVLVKMAAEAAAEAAE